MLDEEPVGALAAAAVVAQTHQHPAAVQSLALERELQVAAAQRLLGRLGPLRNPVAAIPKLHGAAPILAGRNRSFEITVIERMILHLDRETLVGGIVGGAASHRPRLEHAIELEPQVVMQAPRGVLLNDEAQPVRGSASLREVAYGSPLGSAVFEKSRFLR
jgi:hypothetical protein